MHNARGLFYNIYFLVNIWLWESDLDLYLSPSSSSRQEKCFIIITWRTLQDMWHRSSYKLNISFLIFIQVNSSFSIERTQTKCTITVLSPLNSKSVVMKFWNTPGKINVRQLSDHVVHQWSFICSRSSNRYITHYR